MGRAGDIEWRSTLFQTNEDSEGGGIDSSWSFYLGYFAGGFLPTSGNTASWSGNWVTVSATKYDDAFGSRFVGLWENDGSVFAGAKGYIWGVNREGIDQEWILLSGSTWFWPAQGGGSIDPSGNKVVWQVDSANQAVLGTVNSGGVHMKTESVPVGDPPFLNGPAWRELHFSEEELDDSLVSGWEADPDGDGCVNLFEMATGTDPRAGKEKARMRSAVVEDGGLFLTMTIPKGRSVGVTYTGSVSGDLRQWISGPPTVILESETPSSITFRDTTPWAPGKKRFGRVRVELSP